MKLGGDVGRAVQAIEALGYDAWTRVSHVIRTNY